MDKTTIKCSNCYAQIDVHKILYHQVEEEIKSKLHKEQKEFKDELAKKELDYKKLYNELKTEELIIEEQRENLEREIKKSTREQIKIEKKIIYNEVKKDFEQDQQEAMLLLENELNEKSQQIKELNIAKIEISKLKREKEEVELHAKMKAQEELSEEMEKEKERLRNVILKQNEHLLKEKDAEIQKMQREFDKIQRESQKKIDRSQIMEFAIESWLSNQFPFDVIEDLKKREFGLDCVQKVNTRETYNCGIICYESKNQTVWEDDWIYQIKQDMIQVKADIGVLVSSVYPPNMNRMGFFQDIWICNLDEFKGSSSFIRESLIRINKVTQKNENRTDKMNLLYNYMTGDEFSIQMKGIVDGFTQMKSELDKEKMVIMASWQKREKTIDGVLLNTTQMYGALQGIAGSNTIAKIDSFELNQVEKG